MGLINRRKYGKLRLRKRNGGRGGRGLTKCHFRGHPFGRHQCGRPSRRPSRREPHRDRSLENPEFSQAFGAGRAGKTGYQAALAAVVASLVPLGTQLASQLIRGRRAARSIGRGAQPPAIKQAKPVQRPVPAGKRFRRTTIRPQFGPPKVANVAEQAYRGQRYR